ncbi:cadherin-5-like protein [Lates japonicus]|uniref:Cadherin-5 n=1 Tax=Lates japonicus TaxID=270547 RepID=A0AAD3NDI6_LATJO|nr:cadherin-5-like protein [Lates japonicus]
MKKKRGEEEKMMAWLQLWTMGLIATMTLSISFTIAEDSGFPVVEGEKRGLIEIVKKESHPVLFRQKREWIWNSLYVEEEKPAPNPYKIGQLKSSKAVEVKKFKIEGEGANTIFTVDDKGDLFVTTSLDREEKNLYHLTARMFDGNNKLIEDSGDFVVQVTDINDNTPVFPRTYNGSIMERSTIGTKVVEVRATDADDPTTANGELRYSLTQDGEYSAFQIDSNTGVISCKIQTLDRETKSQYVVVVKAQDMRGMASGSTATTSVTITITDVNDNIASFTRNIYELQVPEDHKVNEKIGILEVVDRDQIQNKEPIFTILSDNNNMFNIERNRNKDGNLMLKKALDYETRNNYTFTVRVREDIRFPADSENRPVTTAQVNIRVLDVDEPPVFSQSIYTFTVMEELLVNNIGTVTARDPDRANKRIRYSILDKDCPISINPITGQLSTLRKLDRELEATHMFQVKAQEEPSGLESFVKVNITVQDTNDNKPELAVDEIFVCENDVTNTVIGTLRATDKDDQIAHFSFSLASASSNFSIKDYGIIVILFVMRKRYQKDSLASMKNSGEIHEQLVTYDEEGGGEMDTNGYDVSILTSACHDGSLLRHSDRHPHPSLYAMVQKTPQPTACKGDMAAMIEVKKDEADHDRDGFPYDTLHIYGYEGLESLAGSLSSLESSSTASNLDYDFLNDWGPRFRTLAELYGVDGPEYYHQY